MGISFYFIITLIFLILVWTFRLIFTYVILKLERASTIIGDSQKKFAVILPVLLEKKRIGETVNYFLNALKKYPQSKIVLVTTEKEFNYISHEEHSTIDVCKRLSSEHDAIIHLHLSSNQGKMADQVNFAVESLDDTYIFGLFNADSMPERETFDYVSMHWDTGVIFQQYGDYSRNLGFIRDNDVAGILQSTCAWQNRWTLGSEYFHLLFYSLSRIRRFCFLVGHGIFFSKEIWSNLGSFDAKFHNEDSPFGLKAAWKKATLKAIPFFDVSDSPDTVISSYKQKKSWFLGPLQAFEYHKYYLRDFGLKPGDHLFTIQLFWLSVIWVFGPLLVLFSIIFNISSPIFLLVLVLVLTYQGLLNYASMCMIFKLCNKKEKVPCVIILSSPLAYMIHGFAGIISFIQFLYGRIFNKQVAKEKTIMRGDI